MNPPPPMNPLRGIAAIKIPGLVFQVCEVTPPIAADFLKRNRKNRKLKEATLEGYTRDMKNDAWYLTHQGIAFDDDGNLIDGQHRLEAIVRSKKSVRLFVSAGWPANGKDKTMDAVDRGAARSLADQLHLQHGLPTQEAGNVVKITNSIAAACINGNRVRKLGCSATSRGIKSATVSAVTVMARAVWPEKASDFYTRLKTGENLAGGNAILHLRNWLLGDGANADTCTMRLAATHHLLAFVEGRQVNSLVCSSNAALLKLIGLQGDRAEKIRKMFNAETYAPRATNGTGSTGSADIHGGNGNGNGDGRQPKLNTSPIGDDAVRIGGTLSGTFTTTDLTARIDNPNLPGLWLAHWRRIGWVESAGAREFRKTATFGKS